MTVNSFAIAATAKSSFVSREAKTMKQRLLMVMLVMAVAALCVSPVFAQATGTIKGICKNLDGTPD